MSDGQFAIGASEMIDIYTANTPNGIKIPIAAEELGVPYKLHMLSLARGDQKRPAYQAINPNGRIPAIVDHLVESEEPVQVFESGAILLHLADNHGGLIGHRPADRAATLGWLFLQAAGLGPNFGNAGHFIRLGRDDLAYATDRFKEEARRHLQVLEDRLTSTTWLDGHDYSIADIAHFCWVRSASYAGLDLPDYPNARKWVEAIEARPGVQRALANMQTT